MWVSNVVTKLVAYLVDKLLFTLHLAYTIISNIKLSFFPYSPTIVFTITLGGRNLSLGFVLVYWDKKN